MIIQDNYIYIEETDIMDVTLALIECGVGVSKKEYDKSKKIVFDYVRRGVLCIKSKGR